MDFHSTVTKHSSNDHECYDICDGHYTAMSIEKSTGHE